MAAERIANDAPLPALGVHAAVVAHFPDPGALEALLAALLPQVGKVWLIDNGGLAETAFDRRVEVVGDGSNRGLAGAYNLALELSRAAGASDLLLLDQDSLPAADMVARLLAARGRLLAAGRRVAVVGPSYADAKWDVRVGFVQVRGLRLAAVDARGASEVEAHHLISSGSLFSLDVFDEVGKFAEELFIDYVDIEWCMRAARRGLAAFGVRDARMGHDLGVRAVSSGAPSLTFHSPLRHYYQYRNALWLLGRRWTGWRWRAIDARRMAVKFVLLMREPGQRRDNLRMILRGIGDALRGRMGSIDA